MFEKIVFGISIIIMMYLIYKYETETIQINKYTIKSDKIKKDTSIKVLQISDLHGKQFGKNNRVLKEKIDKINPDLIAITGDIVDGENPDYFSSLEIMKYISKKYKVVYIEGNHEQKALIKKYKNKYKGYFKQLYKMNFTVLKNNVVNISEIINTENMIDKNINIYGLILPYKSYRYLFGSKKTFKISDPFIKNTLPEKKEGFNILLAHSPEYFDLYSRWGADLILSGHVHGGIIRLPFVGGVLSPSRTFFPKYDWGEYKKDKSTMIVSKGLGGSKILVRINCKPELVVITIKNK